MNLRRGRSTAGPDSGPAQSAVHVACVAPGMVRIGMRTHAGPRAPWFVLCLLLSTSSLRADLPEAFRILEQRNLFDPTRQPPRAASPRPTPSTTPNSVAPVERRESLTLLGVVVSGEQAFAHLTGSSPEVRRVARVGDTVAGARVALIETGRVVLELPEGPVTLKVGYQMSRRGDQPWQVEVADTTVVMATSVSTPGAPAPAVTNPSAPATVGGESMGELMRRLMERRQREMQR